VGNAMRQGIWLHGRSRREFSRALARAGFGDVSITTHGPGGMLMLVGATRSERGTAAEMQPARREA